jgi:hypothetical protein
LTRHTCNCYNGTSSIQGMGTAGRFVNQRRGFMKKTTRATSCIVGILLSTLCAYAAEITIGTGTNTGDFPLSTVYYKARTQTIYLASEIGGARTFDWLSLNVATKPGQTMNNFTIRLKHTDLSSYGSSPVWESSGWTTVYQANQTISTTGWVKFVFTTPFAYNGIQNLMVDISFNNSSYTNSGYCYYTSSGVNRSIYYSAYSNYNAPLNWSNRTPTPDAISRFPNMRLGFGVQNVMFNLSSGTYNTEQNVVITCATPGATIRYTIDGSDPNTGSIYEPNSIILIDHSLILKAKAWKEGIEPSNVTSATYQIVVATPVFNPAGGVYNIEKTVTITCATPGATIHYTTNGVDPTESDLTIASGGSVYMDRSMTLKAKAWKGSMTPSNINSAAYQIIVATPAFAPDGGTYNIEKYVIITCATPGVTIRYTTDGSDPSEGLIYEPNSIILIDHSLILKAKAWKGNMTPSSIKSATYQLFVATPVFTPDGGVYDTEQNVTITCATPGATIRYTTDGSDPNWGTITPSGGIVSVNPPTTLKAQAFKTGWTDSSIKTSQYFKRYSGGNGAADNPYQIGTSQDIIAIGDHLDDWGKCFKLMADIDLDGFIFSKALIAPNHISLPDTIGKPFTGIFDGNGYKIKNLTIISVTDANDIGLFGYISNAIIKNLGIENVDLQVQYSESAGGLVGISCDSTILSCYATGSASVGSYYCGGLVGENIRGTISSSYATVTISGYTVGGLAGNNYSGSITSCYAAGSVSGTGGIGGLVGSNSGPITSCYATGTVSGGSGGHEIGGLIGFNYAATISYSYSTGFINTSSARCGLIGENYFLPDTTVSSFWDILTSGKTDSAGGNGLTTEQMKTMRTYQNAGWAGQGWTMNDGMDYPRLNWENSGGISIPPPATPFAGSGTESDPYRIASIQDFIELDGYYFGANTHIKLAVDLDLNGITCYPFGSLGPFGGIFDGDGHTISNILINQPARKFVGLFGVIGYSGIIKNLGLKNINIIGGDCVGGLAGSNLGTIHSCSITGSIDGRGWYTGGLAGENRKGVITACCVNGFVNGTGSEIGGLVGNNLGTISSCYATGAISGNSNDVGGLVGENFGGIISSCYATGTVTGTYRVGGLIGYNAYSSSITTTSSFWDTQTSGQTKGVGYGSSTGVTGKTTAQMKTLSTFTSAGWDFSNTDGDPADWFMPSPPDYPKLVWYSPTTVATPVFTPDGGTYNIEKYVIITCATPGATIRYTTDGSDPNQGLIYEPNSIIPVDHNMTLKAKAWKEGFTPSYVKSATYNLIVSTPAFSVAGGTYNTEQNVVITCATSGAAIHYTTNGLDPTESDPVIASGSSVLVDQSLTLKAKAWKGLLTPSPVKSATYNLIVSTPAFSVAGGTYNTEQNVVVTCATSGATIHYTTNGLDPTESDSVIASGSSVFVDHTLTLKAKAWKGAMTPSGVKSATYQLVLLVVATPVFTPDGGTYNTEQTVTIACATPGATIRYTLDGSDPNFGTIIPSGNSIVVSVEPPTTLNAVASKTGLSYSAAKAIYWTYAGGTGQSNDPYLIADSQQFRFTSLYPNLWNKHFKLMADIDLAGEVFTMAIIAPVTCTIGVFHGTTFSGTFDGNGHKISNFTISGGSNGYLGLFGYLDSGGIIKNLVVEDFSVFGIHHVSGLVGLNYGSISNCYAAGAVSGSWNVGGLVGNNNGSISNCHSTGNVSGGQSVGGLVGTTQCSINSCYSNSIVSGSDKTGGLIGFIYNGSVSNCYSTGFVSGSSYVGGLAGKNYSIVTSSFWDTQTSGQTSSAGGAGKTTAQMKTLSTFTSAGWDFSTTDGDPADWFMPSPPDYPKLAWQQSVGLNEFTLLSQYWQMTGCTTGQPCAAADWYVDGTIDILDLDVLAEFWLAGAIEKQYPPEPNMLAAHWPMDEPAGSSTVSDIAGGHTGQLVNMDPNTCWTAGYYNNALQLDGINDYVRITGYKGISGSQARTCAAWIKATSTGQHQIAMSLGGPDPAQQTWYFGGIFTAPNTNEFAVGIGSSSYIKCSATPFDNQWHHLAVVLPDGSPTTSDIKLYMDGQLRTDTTIVNGTVAINTSGTRDVYLGAYTGNTTPTLFFKGLLDEVRIYSYALSDAEITALAQ